MESEFAPQVSKLHQLSIGLMAASENKDRDVFGQIVHEDFFLLNDTLKNYYINKKIWMGFLFEKF
ncbi:MAG TPA: hypothetical protein VET23_11425 [Chitinophagaceae bacterium]|nr:hypothetical protein [Chitinophagaceae bacterium]